MAVKIFNRDVNLAGDAKLVKDGVTIIDKDGRLQVQTDIVFGDGEYIADTNGNELLAFGVTASAVNEFKITNAATGSSPNFEATGGDTNISMTFSPKGTGYIEQVNDSSGATGAVFEGNHVSASPAQNDKVVILRGRGRDSADNAQVYGQVSVCIDVATNGSEAGFVLFETPDPGTPANLLETGSTYHDGTNATWEFGDGSAAAVLMSSGDFGLVLGGTATDKVGFFGATPIVQQTTTSQTAATFVANTSGISDDTATWGGYTIGDIVAILQAFGMLA